MSTAMNPFIIVNTPPPTLPCSTCQSECCGPIPLYRRQLARIVRFLKSLPGHEIARMSAQKRPPLTCPFVDIEKWQCSIYNLRPTTCRLYGHTPGLVCPHAPSASFEVAEADAHKQLDMERAIYGEEIAGIAGIDLGWKELRQYIAGESQ